MIRIEWTSFFTNPASMLLQEFPEFSGVKVDPIRAEQPGILRTPETPALMLSLTRFPLIRVEIVIDRFVDTTLRAPLLTTTMLLNIRGGVTLRDIPGLLYEQVDMRKFMIGTDIFNSFVYQDRVIRKGLDKSYTLHT